MMCGKKGLNCHMDMSGVMAHAHFGKLTILGKDNVFYTIPERCLFKNGTLKKSWKSIFKREMGYAIPA